MHVLLIIRSGLPLFMHFFVDFNKWATPPYDFFVDFKEWATLLVHFLLICQIDPGLNLLYIK